MPPTFVLRPAQPNDITQVIQLDFEAFSPYGTAESPEIIRTRQQIFPQGFIVAEKDGRIVGYGSSEKWSAMREPEAVWEWVRNPLPPAEEGRHFEVLRRALSVDDRMIIIPGDWLSRLDRPVRQRLRRMAPDFFSGKQSPHPPYCSPHPRLPRKANRSRNRGADAGSYRRAIVRRRQ